MPSALDGSAASSRSYRIPQVCLRFTADTIHSRFWLQDSVEAKMIRWQHRKALGAALICTVIHHPGNGIRANHLYAADDPVLCPEEDAVQSLFQPVVWAKHGVGLAAMVGESILPRPQHLPSVCPATFEATVQIKAVKLRGMSLAIGSFFASDAQEVGITSQWEGA